MGMDQLVLISQLSPIHISISLIFGVVLRKFKPSFNYLWCSADLFAEVHMGGLVNVSSQRRMRLVQVDRRLLR
jgi:hypothetical protein